MLDPLPEILGADLRPFRIDRRHYGFGSDPKLLSLEELTKSNICVIVAESLGIGVTMFSKAAVGYFLLRLVLEQWHKISIIGVLLVFATICVGECTPAHQQGIVEVDLGTRLTEHLCPKSEHLVCLVLVSANICCMESQHGGRLR